MIMVDEHVATHAENGAPPRKGFSVIDLASREKIVTVEFDGSTGDVWYRPWVITPARMREIRIVEGDERDVHRFRCDMLQEFVSRWDVIGSDGAELPVTVEAMEASLPARFIQAVLEAVLEDMQPTPTTGDAS